MLRLTSRACPVRRSCQVPVVSHLVNILRPLYLKPMDRLGFFTLGFGSLLGVEVITNRKIGAVLMRCLTPHTMVLILSLT
jgi:hypothetical protein